MRKAEWEVIGRHKWVVGAIISESVSADGRRRFTATILGYQNWRIWQGKVTDNWSHVLATVMAKVVGFRERIKAGDDSVFEEPQAW